MIKKERRFIKKINKERLKKKLKMKEERQEQLRHLRFKYIITTKLSSKERERSRSTQNLCNSALCLCP